MDSPSEFIVIDDGLVSSTITTGSSQARTAGPEVSDDSDSSTIGDEGAFRDRIEVFQAYSPESSCGISGKRARSGQDESIGLKKRRVSNTDQADGRERGGLSDKAYTVKLMRDTAKSCSDEEVTQIIKALEGPLADRGFMELVPKFDKKPLSGLSTVCKLTKLKLTRAGSDA